MSNIELIYDKDCPNVDAARQQLSVALTQTGLPQDWSEWRRDDVNAPPHAKTFGSPTILVDGKDVVNVAPSEANCCRIYASEDGSLRGVPDVKIIVEALRSSSASNAQFVPPHNWKVQAALLPGIGAALLPSVACPACWPAYAGVLSSIGFGFLLDASVLFPFTSALLAVSVGTLAYRAKRRRGYGPFLLGMASLPVILLGKFSFESDLAMGAGLAALIGASVWNNWPRRSAASCPV